MRSPLSSSASSLPSSFIPLIDLPYSSLDSILHIDRNQSPSDLKHQEKWYEIQQHSKSIRDALQTSGFLLLTSPLIPIDLQSRVLEITQSLFHQYEKEKDTEKEGNTTTQPQQDEKRVKNLNPLENIITHPTDPKCYIMLEPNELNQSYSHSHSNCHTQTQKEMETLIEYITALNQVKNILLYLICFDLPSSPTSSLLDPMRLISQHTQDNNALRLIQYLPFPYANSNSSKEIQIGNRCKEHSDYGTLTLLLTDGNSGLEILYDGENHDTKNNEFESKSSQSSSSSSSSSHCRWIPVPHIPGTLVVNIGSLLSTWSNGIFKATLHRVAGPHSPNASHSQSTLWETVTKERISIAYFVDPNPNVSLDSNEYPFGNALEYLKWRSGTSSTSSNDLHGSSDNTHTRSGVEFTDSEKERIKISNDEN